ncbi:MAG: hypothetical protein JW929_14615 [Anaerolineales bacterium]|nr:hypothetical protein [Anaerolineales bacterium]
MRRNPGKAWVDFERRSTARERRILDGLTTPERLQAFLDRIPYRGEDRYRCPLSFLRDRRGHCYDGAVFAAMALGRMGHPPRIVELLPNRRDDDHILAVYRRDGCWGAVAHSNFTGLRYREPVFRDLRELVMSYFEDFFNVEGEKTLRGFTRPLNLEVFDSHLWMTRDDAMKAIAKGLDRTAKRGILSPRMIRRLARVDERTRRAGLAGAVRSGLFTPR